MCIDLRVTDQTIVSLAESPVSVRVNKGADFAIGCLFESRNMFPGIGLAWEKRGLAQQGCFMTLSMQLFITLCIIY